MTNLITLQEYKDSLGITSPKDDYKTDGIIESVSQLVKTYCGNSFVDFYTVPKVEVFDFPWNLDCIFLTEGPIVGITSVEERVNISDSFTTLTEDSDYYIKEETDSIYRIGTGGIKKNWALGPRTVRITYTAGYEFCPYDLRLAVLDLVTYYLKDEHKERRTLSSASVQNASASNSSVAFPDHIKRVLDLYKVY
jgi:hypothetical protein